MNFWTDVVCALLVVSSMIVQCAWGRALADNQPIRGENHALSSRWKRQSPSTAGVLSWDLQAFKESGDFQDLFIPNFELLPQCSYIDSIPFEQCPSCCEKLAENRIQCSKKLSLPSSDVVASALIVGEIDSSGQADISQAHLETDFEVTGGPESMAGHLRSIDSSIWAKEAGRAQFVTRMTRKRGFRLPNPFHGRPTVSDQTDLIIKVMMEVKCSQAGGEPGVQESCSLPDPGQWPKLVVEYYDRCRNWSWQEYFPNY